MCAEFCVPSDAPSSWRGGLCQLEACGLASLFVCCLRSFYQTTSVHPVSVLILLCKQVKGVRRGFNILRSNLVRTSPSSFFFVSLLLSSFWTRCGLRCHPFPPVRAFSSYRAYQQGSAFPLLADFHRMLLTHAFALSASQVVHKKKSLRILCEYALGGTRTHEIGLRAYSRHEDNPAISLVYTEV